VYRLGYRPSSGHAGGATAADDEHSTIRAAARDAEVAAAAAIRRAENAMAKEAEVAAAAAEAMRLGEPAPGFFFDARPATAPVSYPPPGYPPAGYPPPVYGPQAYPPAGYPTPDYPTGGYGHQAYPPAGFQQPPGYPGFAGHQQPQADWPVHRGFNEAAPPRIDSRIKAAFDRFDTNRSGRLDYRELRNCLNALGIDVTGREAAEVLTSYDADGNGLMEL
jgi:hypothetical protein